MKSLPILTFCKGPSSCPGAVRWRLMMVSMTMAWLRLECAFSLVNANTLWAAQQGESHTHRSGSHDVLANTGTTQTLVIHGQGVTSTQDTCRSYRAETHGQKDRQTDRKTDRQTQKGNKTDRQTQTDRQTDRQTDG